MPKIKNEDLLDQIIISRNRINELENTLEEYDGRITYLEACHQDAIQRGLYLHLSERSE